ncbi:hypothetical protein [Acetobacter orientalis]|uniref:hypothetical protein n=1 Tax=Acetobacter orientalis TaxID=146474 RepID=UPI0039EC4C54
MAQQAWATSQAHERTSYYSTPGLYDSLPPSLHEAQGSPLPISLLTNPNAVLINSAGWCFISFAPPPRDL